MASLFFCFFTGSLLPSFVAVYEFLAIQAIVEECSNISKERTDECCNMILSLVNETPLQLSIESWLVSQVINNITNYPITFWF
jgi:hypothetical protein